MTCTSTELIVENVKLLYMYRSYYVCRTNCKRQLKTRVNEHIKDIMKKCDSFNVISEYRLYRIMNLVGKT